MFLPASKPRGPAGRPVRRHHGGVVERGKDSAARPGVEITLYRQVGWEVLGRLPPLAAGRRNVEDRIYHRSHVSRTPTPVRRCRRQKWLTNHSASVVSLPYRKPSRL